MKAALDTAFLRRLRFVVHFPFPDQEPARGHLAAASSRQRRPGTAWTAPSWPGCSVAGGSIRNIALSAAFLAAEAREPVRMIHLLQAARAEAGKRDRPLSEAETKGWA